MAIQFACQCGKTLKAADEYAGRRAKCNQCGQVVTIPGAKPMPAKVAAAASPAVATAVKRPVAVATPRPAMAAVATVPKSAPAAAPKSDLDDFLSGELAAEAAKPASCPNCREPLSKAAVICMKCSYNLKTGQKMNTLAYAYASPGDSEKSKKRKPRRQSLIGGFITSRLTSGKFMSGLAMMIGAAVWFFAGLYVGIIFFYPPILFLIGAFTFLTGLVDGGD